MLKLRQPLDRRYDLRNPCNSPTPITDVFRSDHGPIKTVSENESKIHESIHIKSFFL